MTSRTILQSNLQIPRFWDDLIDPRNVVGKSTRQCLSVGEGVGGAVATAGEAVATAEEVEVVVAAGITVEVDVVGVAAAAGTTAVEDVVGGAVTMVEREAVVSVALKRILASETCLVSMSKCTR